MYPKQLIIEAYWTWMVWHPRMQLPAFRGRSPILSLLCLLERFADLVAGTLPFFAYLKGSLVAVKSSPTLSFFASLKDSPTLSRALALALAPKLLLPTLSQAHSNCLHPNFCCHFERFADLVAGTTDLYQTFGDFSSSHALRYY
jgi:hypothetical protein